MTTAAIQPINVYALIVGIEKYQAGSDYDLDGPANDALKFANWLLAHGVEPGHIYLFLSPTDRNQGILSSAEDKGLMPSPATHDRIARIIRARLTNERSRGDLLYVFWGGHGIITKMGMTTRRLFFADTDDDTKWNLDFNSLVDALSTSAYGAGFSKQIFLIDACANAFYEGVAQTRQGVAAGVEFAANGDLDQAEQFILFASPEYEVATNNSNTGTGHFSQAVLEIFQEQPLLPNMKAIAEQIQSDFIEKQKVLPSYWIKLPNKQIQCLSKKSSVFGHANNIPPSSVKEFVGRESKLEELHQILEENGGAEICHIEGMGGVGKTELAKQYGLKYLSDYTGGICWIDAKNSDIERKIVNFAVENFGAKFDEVSGSKVNYCWNTWQKWREGNVLIVFDDVTNFTQIKPYLPRQNSQFFVLITTRKTLGASLVSIPLEPLDRDASIQLLKSLIGDERVNRESVAANELCAWLGDLPLGLDLAGRYLLRMRRLSLERLLYLLREKYSLRHGSMRSTDPTMEYQTGVAAAFDLSWDELSEPAQKLGYILALFDLGPVPLTLVEEAINVSSPNETANLILEDIRADFLDGVDASNIVAELEVLNLIRDEDVNNQIVRLHELIREFFRGKRDEESYTEIATDLQHEFSRGMLAIAEQALEASNFSRPHLRALLNFLIRVPKAEQIDTTLLDFLDLLSRYYSFQQYIYDTGYLESAIAKLEGAKTYLQGLEVPNEKAKVLVGKLLGHAYYANPGQHRLQAIQSMLEAQGIANSADQADVTGADHELWLWYQIFLLDHVHNQLSKLPEPVLNLTAEELEAQIAELLPTSLEDINVPPESEDVLPSILRAAHYWGHRGNQVTDQLQRLLFSSLSTVEPAEIESLSEQGIRYYSLAATLRAANFRLSFPQEFQQHLAITLVEVPHLPQWLLNWNPSTNSIEFERFTSASQAVGDIAHQYRGLATVQLWKYFYEVSRGLESTLLDEARIVLDIASRLWEEAKSLLAPGEQVIKYYMWMASSEMMLLLLERYNSNDQFPTQSEVEEQASAQIDELQEQYGLVYEWAKDKVLDLARGFHNLLSNLQRSP
ncbi:caspase family protein [Cyanobacteria bacterium FACHB-502]|nr:caspase family protein [Cyanobacteria bacterium FACHB-502]